jgi:hypothetical protein
MELKKLAGIANKLDSLGLTKEADIIDNFIAKVAAARPNVSKNAQFCIQSMARFSMLSQENKSDIIRKVQLIEPPYPEVGSHGRDSVLRLYIIFYLIEKTLPFQDVLYDDIKMQAALERDIDKYRKMGPVSVGTGAGKPGGRPGAGKVSSKPSSAGTGAGGKGAGGAGGVDSWARYIATAKDPKTGKVDTELNTRVKQIWQSTRPADKEFSGFTSWYRQTKDNMSAYGMTPKDFGQEQAIALIQITGGSAKGWQQSDKAMRSVYENIAGQDPASFNPSSVGLSRSGVGYAADIKNYNPTDGRTSAPAQALLRSQMAIPAEEEYAGRAETFRDDSEFEFAPGAEKEMAARRQRSQQAMSGPTYQQGTSDELKYKTKNLLSR